MSPQMDTPQDSDTTKREMIERIGFVFDHILSLVPQSERHSNRFRIFKQLAKDALKDIALVPDEIISKMSMEVSMAFQFIAEGSMEDLLEYLAEQENERALVQK
jgi:hypothetical protein